MRSPGRPDRDAVIAAASRRYLRGEPIDMSTLATELNVSRATLYRKVGNRDQLIGLMLAEYTEQTFHWATRHIATTGPQRVLDVLDQFMLAVVGTEALKRFARQEPLAFVRVVTAPGLVEDRATRLIGEVLDEEVESGRMSLCLPTAAIAKALVRIGDAFMYGHLLGGREAEVDTALEVARLLLTNTSRAGEP